MFLEFFVEGKPIGKASTRQGKYKNFYIPKKSREYMDLISYSAKVQMRGSQLSEKAIGVRLLFKFKIPKNKSKSISGRDYMVSKPDIDNLQKCVLDALSGIVYKDDNQIAWIHVEKTYVSSEFKQGVLIVINELES